MASMEINLLVVKLTLSGRKSTVMGALAMGSEGVIEAAVYGPDIHFCSTVKYGQHSSTEY